MRLAPSWRVVVAALLLGSLGLNAWLYRTLRQERAAAAAARATPAAPAPVTPAERREAERRETLAGLIRELGGRAAALQRAPHPLEAMRGEGGAPADSSRQLLCDIGREQAKQRWEPWKEDVLHLMRWYMSDPGTQERKIVEKTAEMQKILGLSTQEGYQLLSDYQGVRRERVAEVRRLIDQEPADWNGVFDQIKGLQGDEDALVRKRFGPERAGQLAASLREERLLLLTVLATYADRPWEDALGK